jgi:hypothetical protein
MAFIIRQQVGDFIITFPVDFKLTRYKIQDHHLGRIVFQGSFQQGIMEKYMFPVKTGIKK